MKKSSPAMSVEGSLTVLLGSYKDKMEFAQSKADGAALLEIYNSLRGDLSYEDYSKISEKQVLLALLKNDNCPLEALRGFSKKNNLLGYKEQNTMKDFYFILSHKNLPAKDLLQNFLIVAEMKNYLAMEQLLKNPNAPKDLIDKVANIDEDRIIAVFLEKTSSKKLFFKKIGQWAENGSTRRYIRGALFNPLVPAHVLHTVVKQEGYYLKEAEVKAIVNHPEVALSTLKELKAITKHCKKDIDHRIEEILEG